MKGIQGLVIATVLGLIGAVVNWVYLNDQSKSETVTIVVVAPDKKIKQGQEFKAGDLMEVKVPKMHAGSLLQVAYTGKDFVVGRATRDYQGNDIILREELKTVSHGELPLGEKEAAICVQIGKFNTEQIIPGQTQVKFRLARIGPTPVGAPSEPAWELVGPFDVLSVGNRRGDIDTFRSEGGRPSQEDKLTLRATLVGSKLDERSTRLLNHLDKNANRPLDVVLVPAPPAKK